MPRPDKTNFLHSVPVSLSLSQFKKQLAEEDLYFGYHPLCEGDLTLAELLKLKPVNLYHFKYGSLPAQVRGLVAELDTGDLWESSVLPDAAGGPNLLRLVLDLPSTLTRLNQVTFTISPRPEKMELLLLGVPTEIKAINILGQLVSQSVNPLFFHLLDAKKLDGFLPQSWSHKDVKNILFLGFSGLAELVDADTAWVSGLAKETSLPVMIPKDSTPDLLTQFVFATDNHTDIISQYQHMIWPAGTSATNTEQLQKKLFDSFDTPEVSHV